MRTLARCIGHAMKAVICSKEPQNVVAEPGEPDIVDAPERRVEQSLLQQVWLLEGVAAQRVAQ